MFLISSNLSNNLIFQQLVWKRNKDNTNLEIKQKDRQMTDFQIFQMTCEKDKNLKLYSMDELLYFKNTMASI